MMSKRGSVTSQFRSSKAKSEFQVHVCGAPYSLNRALLAAKSAMLSRVLKENPHYDISHVLQDIPADQETFEIVARFCHGFGIDLSIENVVRVCCLAHYLEMTEKHCPDNLLKKSCAFFEQNIVPSWNKCINALKNMEKILQESASMGLVDACVCSIIKKALDDPRLLGAPIRSSDTDCDSDDNEIIYRPNPRRKLFALDYESEDLTALSLTLYEPIIRAMVQHKVPLEYVTASICRYARKWAFPGGREEEDSTYKMNSQREVIEAVERLLPHERGLLPCTILFEMLNVAVSLNANPQCTEGLELRIGMQLNQATVKDLLIPSQGYAKDEKYDTKCVKRILRNFYSHSIDRDASGLITVADLIDEFLSEVAGDIDLKLTTFVSLADMSVAASSGTSRNTDGIYRAVDIYLDKHRYLTESEKEEVCKVLDCSRMSPEACQHAAQNERLPLRLVVQILFVAQLQLRDTIVKEAKVPDGRLLKLDGEEEIETRVSGAEEEARTEMEKMGSKVTELEKECSVIRREIQSSCCSKHNKGKTSMWKEMKRKIGCSTSMHDCNCHVKKKKVHPR